MTDEHSGAPHARARALYAAGRTEQAAALLSRALGRAPDDAAARLLLGMCRLDLGDAAGAADAAGEAVRADPGSATAWRLRATALVRLDGKDGGAGGAGAGAEALAAAREAVRLDPGHWASRAALARALGRRGPDQDRAGAYEAARQAVRLGPEEVHAHRTAAWAAHRVGRHAEARNACHAALRLAPDDAATHRLLAALDSDSRGTPPRSSLEAHARALALDPGDDGSRINLEAALFRRLARPPGLPFLCLLLALLGPGALGLLALPWALPALLATGGVWAALLLRGLPFRVRPGLLRLIRSSGPLRARLANRVLPWLAALLSLALPSDGGALWCAGCAGTAVAMAATQVVGWALLRHRAPSPR